MSNIDDFFGGNFNTGGNKDVVAGFIQKLAIDCNSDTQVVIKSGSKVGADDGSEVMSVTGDITLSITSSGAGGLDTGSEASDTWYYIWLIKNGSSGNLSGILSTSSTSPTMPSSYTKKRWIGAVRNDGSSNFMRYAQVGRRCTYRDSHNFSSGLTSNNWTTFNLSALIPTGSSKVIIMSIASTNGSGSAYLFFSPFQESGAGGSGSHGNWLNYANTDVLNTNTSTKVVRSNKIISLYTYFGGGSTGSVSSYISGFELSI